VRTLHLLCRRSRAALIMLNSPRKKPAGGSESRAGTVWNNETRRWWNAPGPVRHVADLLGFRRRSRRRRGRRRRRLRTAAGQQQEPLERVHQVLDAALTGLREARHSLLHRRAPPRRPLPRAAALFVAAPARLVEGGREVGPHLAAPSLGQVARLRRRRSHGPRGERARPRPPPARRRGAPPGGRLAAVALPEPLDSAPERDRHVLRRRDRAAVPRGRRRRQHRERPPRRASGPPRRGRHLSPITARSEATKKRKPSNREPAGDADRRLMRGEFGWELAFSNPQRRRDTGFI
jgi:hypothetical protein